MDSVSTPRDILAANLRRLMGHGLPAGETVSVRAWAQGKGLDVKLIERTLKKMNAPTVDSLQSIADACGVKPWHLLYEDFDPAALPEQPISAEDRALIQRLRHLLDKV